MEVRINIKHSGVLSVYFATVFEILLGDWLTAFLPFSVFMSNKCASLTLPVTPFRNERWNIYDIF